MELPPLRDTVSRRVGGDASGSGSEQALQRKPRAVPVSDGDDLRHPLLGDAPTLRLMPDPQSVVGFTHGPGAMGVSAGRRHGGGGGGDQAPNFVERLLGLAKLRQQAANGGGAVLPQRLEPKTFFANERTFLSWLHMAITIGSIAAALLGFASGADADPAQALSRHMVEMIALILLPLGVAMSGYALYLFWWRAAAIRSKRAVHMDDRTGPLALCCAVIIALFAILILSIVDFVQVMHARGKGGAPPSAAAAAAARILASVLPGGGSAHAASA